MKARVILDIPITGHFSTIKLPGPCIYCGKPVEKDGFTWVGEHSYNILKWGVSQKWGDHQVYPVKVNGVPQMGTVRVEAPYCSEHKEGVKLFKWARLITILLGLIAGIIFLIMAWPNVTNGTWMDIVAIIMFPSFGAFAGFLLSILVIRIVFLFVGAKRDFPTFNKGHWGLVIDGETVDRGELGVGPIQYFLMVSFLNPESAKRALEAFPGARVSKGEKLLQE